MYNTFGNTEGAFLKSGALDIENILRRSESVPVGRPSPGQALKLCAVDGGGQAPHDGNQHCEGSEVVGELHVSSPGACSGYIGIEQSPAFYRDEHGRAWYATGDQARIDSEGNISIIGRYKDMIIRGGENISPAAVEASLTRPFSSLDIQIVGVPDPDGLAGQVPVAVTRTAADSETIMAIRETVRKAMGPASCPEEVLCLAQLDMKDYPQTTSRKVKKRDLADAVHRYLRVRDQGAGDSAVLKNGVPSATFEKLRATWARILGIDESSLSPESHMAQLADSIAATRLLDLVSKTFGKILTIAELTQAATLQRQSDLLESKPQRANNGEPHQPTPGKRPAGPPGIEDMVHLTEGPDQFSSTRAAIQQAIAHTGLTWDDVREVMPAHDMNRLSVLLGQMNRLNLKTCLVMEDTSTSKEQLYDALEAVFANNKQLASFEVLVKCSSGQDDLVLHVVTSQPRDFLEHHIFRDGGVLETVEELKRMASGRQFPDHTDATYPGPLIKIDIFFIREIGSLALLVNSEYPHSSCSSQSSVPGGLHLTQVPAAANHSILDATSAQLFYEDLDAALTKPMQPLLPAAPYKPWLDSFYTLRNSPAARAAVKYQVQNLQDMGRHRHAIWPTHPPAYLPRQISKKSQTLDGSVLSTLGVPGLARLRKEHPSIGPHIPLKAAMAMFLMRKTGHTHALFAQTEAERTRWPFWPKSLGMYRVQDRVLFGMTLYSPRLRYWVFEDKRLPANASFSMTLPIGERPAADIRGQTLQTVVSITSVEQEETVLSYLKRMQAEQTLQTRHAAAPRLSVMNDLGESGELVPWVANTALFVRLFPLPISAEPHRFILQLHPERLPGVRRNQLLATGTFCNVLRWSSLTNTLLCY